MNSNHVWWKRVLCFFGVHWEGRTGLGMFGDAGRCFICGADAYGLKVVHDKSVRGASQREINKC